MRPEFGSNPAQYKVLARPNFSFGLALKLDLNVFIKLTQKEVFLSNFLGLFTSFFEPKKTNVKKKKKMIL